MNAIGILLGFQFFAVALQCYLLYRVDELIRELRVNFIPIPFEIVHETAVEQVEVPVLYDENEDPTDPGANGGLQ